MKRVLLLAVALACVQAASAAERPPVWALSEPLVDGPAWLVQVDPVSFARRPGPPVPLGPFTAAPAVSPDGSLLAATPADATVLGVFDLDARRLLFTLGIGSGAGRKPWEVHWLSAARIAAVTAVGRGRSPELVLVDVPSRRVVRRQRLTGEIGPVRAADGRLVLLVSQAGRIATPTVYVLDHDGALRRTSLRPVRMGSTSGPPARELLPGLAADPTGETAYVVPADGPLVAVDLASLRVRTVPVRTTAVSLRAAKGAAGTWVHAHWLAGGLLATVTGDGRPVRGGVRQSPRGLRFLDAATGAARVIDTRAVDFWVAGELVVAQDQESLRAFRLDGSLAWEASFDDLLGIVRVVGGFLHVLRKDVRTSVLEAATGVELAEIGSPTRELVPLGDRDAR